MLPQKILDGIIDPDLWVKAPRKVLFVLKEPGVAGDWGSLQELFIRKWERQARYSFINLGRWAYAIQFSTAESRPDFDRANDKKSRDLAFMSSAVINLRKIPSDRLDKSCDETRLAKEARDGAQEIALQMTEIRPQVVVCCGRSVYEAVTHLPGTKPSGLKILEICHPTSRGWRDSSGVIRRTAKEKYVALTQTYQ